MNSRATLAVLAGAAIGARVVVNAPAVRFLGVGALFGVPGLATAATGFAVAYFSHPGMAGRAILYAVVSGGLGAFILAAASGRTGLAQTLRPSSRAGSSPAC